MQRWAVNLQDSSWQNAAETRAVSAALKAGELVAVPTETVYGLAADATSGLACARIYQAKGRPRFNPLISHVESLDAALKHGNFDKRALLLAKTFWPGPLTIVVPKVPDSPVCSLATAGLNTIALRVPASAVMRFLCQSTGLPLAAPSANISGKVSGTTADAVISDLGSSLSYIVDAGPCPIGIESTIVALNTATPVLLRPGGIAREDLEAALGTPLAEPFPSTAQCAPAAPGMLSSHYAPRAAVRLNALEVNEGEALLAYGGTAPSASEKAVMNINLSRDANLAEAAAGLFSALRQLDTSGAHTICVQPIPAEGLGEAINDRLQRAAAPRQ